MGTFNPSLLLGRLFLLIHVFSEFTLSSPNTFSLLLIHLLSSLKHFLFVFHMISSLYTFCPCSPYLRLILFLLFLLVIRPFSPPKTLSLLLIRLLSSLHTFSPSSTYLLLITFSPHLSHYPSLYTCSPPYMYLQHPLSSFHTTLIFHF